MAAPSQVLGYTISRKTGAGQEYFDCFSIGMETCHSKFLAFDMSDGPPLGASWVEAYKHVILYAHSSLSTSNMLIIMFLMMNFEVLLMTLSVSFPVTRMEALPLMIFLKKSPGASRGLTILRIAYLAAPGIVLC